MLFEEGKNRMFQLLCFVGYCIEFPKKLAGRVGGHPGWSRHVMYQALNEGYLELYHREVSKRVVASLRLTDKGLEYIAERSAQVFWLIMARRKNTPQDTHSSPKRVLRCHAFTTAMIMANNAGAIVLPGEKPPITRAESLCDPVDIDPDTPYFYSTQEIRDAIMECNPETMPKGSCIAGVIVQGMDCYCMYFTGNTRTYWFRSIEENFAASIQSILCTRGFKTRNIIQIMIGSRIAVAAKLSRRKNFKGTRYFVLSDFFNNCYFLTDDASGDLQLKMILHKDMRLKINERVLEGCRFPDRPSRVFDAIDRAEERPVILNYTFDLLILPDLDLLTEGFDEPPIVYCFDHQVAIQQQIVGTMVEVRGIGEIRDYGRT